MSQVSIVYPVSLGSSISNVGCTQLIHTFAAASLLAAAADSKEEGLRGRVMCPVFSLHYCELVRSVVNLPHTWS